MFKSAATRLAHNSTIPALGGNKDLRPLQDLINAEKAVLNSTHKLGIDIEKAASALRAWGQYEGEDLADVLNGSCILLGAFSAALTQYATYEQTIREQMKAVRAREEQLDELRKQRKNLAKQAESADKKLARMGSEHKSLNLQHDLLAQLKSQIRVLDTEIMVQEASLSDFKRATTWQWMSLKFGGLVECSEKAIIVGETGRLMIAEIPGDVTQPGLPRGPYRGGTRISTLIADAERGMSEVSFQTTKHAPTYQTTSVPSQPATLPVELSDADQFTEGNESAPVPNPLGTRPGLTGPDRGTILNADVSSNRFNGESGTFSRDPSQTYSLDDMGFIAQTNQSQGGSARGGRFATFPVKRGKSISQTRPTASQDGGSSVAPLVVATPNLTDSQRKDSSFESEVNRALWERNQALPTFDQQESQNTDVLGLNEPRDFGAGRLNISPPAQMRMPVPSIPPPQVSPPYSSTVAQEVVPDTIHQSNDTPLSNPWADISPGHGRNESVSSTRLPYMIDEDEAHARPSRHVRFGLVSDVEEELSKRDHSPNSRTEQARPTVIVDLNRRLPQPPPLGVNIANAGLPASHRVPPAQYATQQELLDEEIENNRDAAAVHGQSREPSVSPLVAPRTPSPIRADANQPPPSPLVPPAPLFARGETDLISPEVPYPTPPNASPYSSAPPGGQISSIPSNNPIASTPLPAATPSPLRTLPLQIHTVSTPTRDTVALGSAIGPSPPSPTTSHSPIGARTIAAAAFKRNQVRIASGSLSETNAAGVESTGFMPFADTSPLRKRTLPRSPRPQRSLQVQPLGAGTPTLARNELSVPDTQPSAQANDTSGENDFILPSAGRTRTVSPLSSPQPQTSAVLEQATSVPTPPSGEPFPPPDNPRHSPNQGPTSATNQPPLSPVRGNIPASPVSPVSASYDDDQFDYISAYVNGEDGRASVIRGLSLDDAPPRYSLEPQQE